ncbi:MAG: ClpXP protease specificity-enhancing factor SspB [Myxococcales bacterium]|nr:ClpXP protease specificity-enhancing factor SspB [Myxococcales bacterium]
MAEEKPLPPKLDVARYLLAQGNLFVHLDPRAESVVVPKWYRSEPQLVLQIGLDLPVPIPDLEVDAEGIYCTLSFNRAPFTCKVHWDAVFALAGDDGRGMVWPDSMPEEISQEIEREAGRQPPPVVEERPSLRVLPAVDGEKRQSEPPRPGDRPPYLKVVK